MNFYASKMLNNQDDYDSHAYGCDTRMLFYMLWYLAPVRNLFIIIFILSFPSSFPFQVSILQKKFSDISDLLARMSNRAEQVVGGKITTQSYAKEEDANRKQLSQMTTDTETLVQSL